MAHRIAGERIGPRALNRTTLHRQHLLARSTNDVVQMVEHLGGLNAQVPDPPYLSLWSRLAGFSRSTLTEAIGTRRLVRTPLHRGTQRLVSAADLVWLRPTIQPVLTALQHSVFARRLPGVDPAALAAAATEALQEGPLSGSQLRDALLARWPGQDRAALAGSAHLLVATVALPEASRWGSRTRPAYTSAPMWIGHALAQRAEAERLVRAYLAAFGPASPADLRTFTRLPGLAGVFDRMRPELRVLTGPGGRELFDLPDLPLADPDTPAPVRFLPDFDELGLAYADRSRVIPDEFRAAICLPDILNAMVLVDGMAAALWRYQVQHDRVFVEVQPLRSLTGAEQQAIEAEGASLARFIDGDRDPEVRILATRS